MVEEINNLKQNNVYICNECKLKYRDKEMAEKCEAWCKKNQSCNLEIIKYAIKEDIS